MRDGALIWDLPVRLMHWALVLCLLGCYATSKLGWLPMSLHFWFGYGVLGIVLLRLAWGVVGGEHARFNAFVRGPRAVFGHLRHLFGSGYQPSAGHNPLGGWAVLLLLLLTGAQAVLGLFTSDGIENFGPLSERIDPDLMERLSDWHRLLELWLLLLVALHVAAVLLYALLRHESLLPAMWHGRKPLAVPDARRAPWWLAWLLALAVAVLLWAVLRYWPDPGYLGSGM